MKILIVSESYWPNADGGALFERRLVHGLIARGHKVTVWAPSPAFSSFDEVDGDSLIHRERSVVFLPNKKYRFSFMPFFSARRILNRERPDVIHTHTAYFMGLAIMFWARRYRIPIVATNHFMPENLIGNLRWPKIFDRLLTKLTWGFLIWFHNKASFVTSPTPTAIRLLEEQGLRAPHRAVTNGVDTELFKPGQDTTSVIKKYTLATDRPIILYLGRIDGEKRIDVIIDAFDQVLQTHPAQLVLAGFGALVPELKKQVKALGIEDQVVFTGFVDEADKPLIYNAATMFVIASPAELQSIVLLEAMASGLPVISVDVAALHELCHDNENGYLFPNADVSALAEKIKKLLDSPELQKKFGAESVRIVKELHGTQYMLDEFEKVYKFVAE